VVSETISRDIAPDEVGIARSRVLFLCHEDPEPPTVRPTILASWRRSRDFNVAADRIELPYIRDPDIENQLARSAEPVLRQLGEQLDGQPMSIVLTDQTGLVLNRRSADKSLDRHLDGVLLAPGFSYAEQFVGTNGIGTALESGAATVVFGHEHYAEHLEDLACAGVPIHHPTTGRAIGVVDLTCWRKDAGSLLLTLAKTTAEQIQQSLLADSHLHEIELFRAYRRACHRLTGIVFALTKDAVLLNDRARAMLAPADQDALFARAAESADVDSPTRPATLTVALPSGIAARMHCQQVHVGPDLAGVVVHVQLEEPTHAAPAPVVRTPAAMLLPGLVGGAPLWQRACSEVDAAFTTREWIAVAGEAGVGKMALLRAVQVRCGNTGRFVVLDAETAADDPHWVQEARRVIEDGVDTAVVRHVDRLSGPALRGLSAVLQAARNTPGARVPRIAITLGPGVPGDGVAALLRLFPTTVEVPPLRMRLDDMDRLVSFLLGKLTGGGRLTCSPEAMRLLTRASWPGNVAQLNELLHAVVQHRRSGVVLPEDLPPEVHTVSRRLLSPLESMERDAIISSLADARGNKIKAARSLGMSRATIYRRIHDYGIVPEQAPKKRVPQESR
jgi:transcriptional regulator of acetoin/glycerol metabolism